MIAALRSGTVQRIFEGMTPSMRRIAGASIIAFVALLWFLTMPLGILVGDDVDLVWKVLHGQVASSIPQSFAQPSYEKYRPLLNVIFSLVIPLFRGNFAAYEALNIVIETASALLVYAIVLRLTRGHGLLAIACAIAFVVSRFAYYNVMQMEGLLEGLPLLLMLVIIRDAVDAFTLARYDQLPRTAAWYAVMIFIDERYLVMGLFVLACAVLHPCRRDHPRAFTITAGGAVAAAGANVGLKLLMHIHVLVGTGGKLIHLDMQCVAFVVSALQNVLGFNVGPDYLSGLELSEAGTPGYLLGILFAVPAIGLFTAFTWFALRDRRRDFVRGIVMGLALFVPLLLSTAVTFRQELRWIYAPATVVLIGVAAVSVRIEPRRWAVAAAVTVFAASTAAGIWYRPSDIANVFFMRAMRIAITVRDLMTSEPGAPVVIAQHGEASVGRWVFGHGEFASVYGFDPGRMIFIDELRDPHPARAQIVSIERYGAVMLDDLAARGVPATAAAAATLATRTESAVPAVVPTPSVVPFRRSVLSFTKSFATGTINDARDIGTPNHRGALVYAWPAPGTSVESLTLVSGFRYTYPPARIPRHAALAFYAGRPYPGGTPTRGFITVQDGSSRTLVFDEKLPPADATGIRWERHVIDMKRFAGRFVALTFGADAVVDPTSAWVAFGFPALVEGD